MLKSPGLSATPATHPFFTSHHPHSSKCVRSCGAFWEDGGNRCYIGENSRAFYWQLADTAIEDGIGRGGCESRAWGRGHGTCKRHGEKLPVRNILEEVLCWGQLHTHLFPSHPSSRSYPTWSTALNSSELGGDRHRPQMWRGVHWILSSTLATGYVRRGPATVRYAPSSGCKPTHPVQGQNMMVICNGAPEMLQWRSAFWIKKLIPKTHFWCAVILKLKFTLTLKECFPIPCIVHTFLFCLKRICN